MKTLIFVYNAKTDFLNKSLDFAHKIISPSTYACDLCNLTHGSFYEKKIWKDFREGIDEEFIFMYKNEFLNTYSSKIAYDFPIILKEENEEITVFLNAEQLAALRSSEELVMVIKEKLN